ncbi:TerC family protein [Halobacillus shinanisalinarum]|uniref:TerC family protein n=1 Tax=Halobacillus shinanisalinarum TaxID=2932258 RepID=A0ABY4GVF4_9BACI|nr:TerC family protein [Halobacillus shinanisalinarum]UOQ92155.1 TerC family protein [Halobacillus shinanisalinarum]
MDSIWLEYGWTLLVLIGLEGILSADNALVLAVIAKHLPDDQKKRAIDYGILMAFVFRFAAIFLISFLAGVWQVQAIGAAYLIYLGVKHVYATFFVSKKENEEDDADKAGSGFWPTVAKIGVADVAFAIDSILAAVALAVTLPSTPLPKFGGMDGGQYVVIVTATIAGLVLIKFAANWFVQLLEERPGLETTAYMIVTWVGVKLAIITLSHHNVGILPESFSHSTLWTITFWTVLLTIAIGGWFLSDKRASQREYSN